MMHKLLLISPAILLCGTALVAVEQTTAQQDTNTQSGAPYVVPVEIARKPNPVPVTAAGLARAKKVYGWDCAMCHGDTGDGKSELATSMKLQLADFHSPATLASQTDGELFYLIRHGKGKMPAEGDRTRDEDIWNLVHYLRNMAKGAAAAPVAEPPAAPAAEPAK